MEWKHGKPITDRGLSNLLRGFKIRSGQFRYNEKKYAGIGRKTFLMPGRGIYPVQMVQI